MKRMALTSPNRFTTNKLYFFSLQAVMTLVLTLAIPTSTYAGDCKAEIAQLKQEIQELEVRTETSYQAWQKTQGGSDFIIKLFYDIWQTDAEILKIKKSILMSNEKSCLDSVSSTGKKPAAVVEDEGQEMELAASLTVTKQSNKYLIKVESNISDGTFSLVATKKGAKSISFKVGTDDAGSYALRTTRNLKGYLLVLKYNGELLDKIQVN
jgi:hypothetical protein